MKEYFEHTGHNASELSFIMNCFGGRGVTENRL